MSRKDRKDRAGLTPATIDLTASEVRDETDAPSRTDAGAEAASGDRDRPPEIIEAEATPSDTVRPADIDAVNTDAVNTDTVDTARDDEPLRAETAFAQAVDSERDPPQSTESPMPPPQQRSGGSWRAWTLGLLASAAIGAGGVWWLTGQATAPAEVAALKSRVEAAEARVETMGRDLAAARTALSEVSAALTGANSKQAEALAALDQKIAAIPTGGADNAIKSQVESQRDAIARLDAAVGDLKAAIASASKSGDAGAAMAEAQMKLTEFATRLDELAAKMSALPQGGAAADAALGQMTSRLDGLEQRLTDGLAQAGAATAAPKALTAALTSLEFKLAQGAPFAPELAAARKAAPQLAALAALEPVAAAGAPTLDQLKASFADVAAAVNAAAEAPAPAPQTMWDSVMAKLAGVVKVRHRSAVAWPDAVAAAGKQLAGGDLAAAVATLSQPPDPPPAVAQWRQGAQSRLDADKALKDAMQDAVRLMSGAANGG